MTGIPYDIHIKIKTSISRIIDFPLKQRCLKYPKKEVKLSLYIEKKYCNCFCILLRCKHSGTWQCPSHFCYYLFLQTFQLSRFSQVSTSLWYPVPVFRIESICTDFYISHRINFHIYIIFHQQCKTIHL